jgi:hypothetical protein
VASGGTVSGTATLLDNGGNPVIGGPALTVDFSTTPAPGTCSPASGTESMGSSGVSGTFSCTAGGQGALQLTAAMAFGAQPSALASSSIWAVGPVPVPPSQSVTRTLQPGWNTLSLPFAPSTASSTLGSLVPNGVRVAYTYDCTAVSASSASAGDCWVQVTGPLPSPMQGLYVDISGSSPVTVTMTPSGSPSQPPQFALQPGWNLVGPSSTTQVQNVSDFFAGVSPSAVPVWVNPNKQPATSATDPEATSDHAVSDGYAYWVYAESGGQHLIGAIPTGNAQP